MTSRGIDSGLTGHKASRPKPGPKPDRLKIEGNWKEVLRETLKKKNPPEEQGSGGEDEDVGVEDA